MTLVTLLPATASSSPPAGPQGQDSSPPRTHEPTAEPGASPSWAGLGGARMSTPRHLAQISDNEEDESDLPLLSAAAGAARRGGDGRLPRMSMPEGLMGLGLGGGGRAGGPAVAGAPLLPAVSGATTSLQQQHAGTLAAGSGGGGRGRGGAGRGSGAGSSPGAGRQARVSLPDGILFGASSATAAAAGGVPEAPLGGGDKAASGAGGRPGEQTRGAARHTQAWQL